MRINRYIAASTDLSRRQADEVIKENRATVNGKVLKDFSYQVNLEDTVTIDGEEIKPQHLVYYALNKPHGVTSSTADAHADTLVTDLVPDTPPVFPVGRLDLNSTGLIILTNDGAFAQKIQHPSFQHEKEYVVKLKESFHKSNKDKLEAGVELEEGVAKFDDIKIINNTEVSVTLHQGWKRQIRRMFEGIGFKRIELHRVRISKLKLGLLKLGQYKIIKPEDVI